MRNIFNILILLFLTSVVFSQESNEQLIIENANLVRRVTEGYKEINNAYGMVQLSQGKFTMRCDTAINYIQDNLWDIIGNVIVFDSLKTLYTSRMYVNINEEKVTLPEPFKIIDEKGREFFANKGVYYYKKKNVWAFGDVKYKDNIGERTGTCRIFEYYDDRKLAVLTENVEIIDYKENSKITGENLLYYKDHEQVIIDRSPKLYYYGDENTDTTIVISEYMTAYIDSSLFIAIDSVKFFRENFYGVCDSAMFYKDDERFELYKNPIVRQENSELKGEIIHMYLQKNELQKVYVLGNAVALTQADTAGVIDDKNMLLGKIITMLLKDNKIETLISEKNAISYFFIYDNGQNQGANKTVAGKIILIFEEGKIIKVFQEGSVLGRFFPPDLKNIILEDMKNPEKGLELGIDITKLKTRKKKNERTGRERAFEDIREKTGRR